MSAALKQIVSAIQKVDNSVYKVLSSLSTTQLQKLADDAGLYVATPFVLKDTVRLAYDVGDINSDDIFNVWRYQLG